MSSAAPRRARPFPCHNARAEASRQNGAKSRGPKTTKARPVGAECPEARHARAEVLVLPDEDAAEFAGLEAALVEELAPVGALQAVLARRVAVAAWRLARADRIETELFEERRSAERRARARADPRRQRRAVVRDAAALPRRGHGRVLARAQDAQGAPGRAACPRRHVGRGVSCSRADRSSATGSNGAPSDTGPPRGAPEHQRTEAASGTGRTRARSPAPPGICRRRAIHIRPHAARARRSLAAERTRERPHGMHRRPQGSEWAAPLTVGRRLASLTVRGHRA